MDFDVTKFMSKIDSQGGIARRNRYSVEVTPPLGLPSPWRGDQISFLAKNAMFPEKSFGTTTYRSGGRFTLEVPYETTFSVIAIVFLNTNHHAPRKFWNAWFEFIQGVGPSQINYYMKYYKDFVVSIKITNYAEDVQDAYSSTGEGKYEVTLHNAWPKILSNIDVGWENTELSDFTVDISFSHWTEEGAS